MTKLFYSPTTQCAYPEHLKARYEKAGNWPEDAVVLTEKEEVDYWQSPSADHVRGTSEGRPVWLEVDPAVYLGRAKSNIDNAAGRARSRFITTVPGQEGTYQLKVNEALDYISAGSPADTSLYVMLTAEAEGRNIPVSDLANEVLLVRDQWVLIAAQIEKLRMSGKIAVANAADGSDLNAVAQPFIDQLNLIQPV